MSRILLVDDEPNIRKILTLCLTQAGHETVGLPSAEDALETLRRESFDLLISDVRLGAGMDGIGLLQESLALRPSLPVIIITAYGTIELAVEAMKLGAADFVKKPFRMEEFRLTVNQVLERCRPNRPPADAPGPGDVSLHFGLLVGESPEMQLIYERIEKIARSDASVLIEGESGTGKELVAKAIHLSSRRASAPWIALNCAALPASLLESEMFGHAAGAFTGATQRKDGLFLAANGGTLFLDEIGSLELGLQSKLLRVLQERRVRRIGETEDFPVDVRVIAATNESLESKKDTGSFREDLFYRISVIPIDLPPLRRRAGDIPLIVRHFLNVQGALLQTPLTLDEGVMAVFMDYSWPGNVRELANAIACAAALCHDGCIRRGDLPPRLLRGREAEAAAAPKQLQGAPVLLRDFLRDREKEYMEQVIQHTGGNRARAAELLGISRATLYRKLEGDQADVSVEG